MLELTGGPQERDASDHKDGRVLGRDASGNKLFGGSRNGSSLLSESGSSSLDGDGGPCFDWVSKQNTGRGSEGGGEEGFGVLLSFLVASKHWELCIPPTRIDGHTG